MAHATSGKPDWLILVSTFSGPNSARPTSLRRTVFAFGADDDVVEFFGFRQIPDGFHRKLGVVPVSLPDGNSTFGH
jgi:hypothetical protein